MRNVAVLTLMAAVLALLTVGCGGADPTPTAAAAPSAAAGDPTPAASEVIGQEVTVTTTGSLTFQPNDISVEPGQTVRFTIRNDTSFSHTFTIAVTTAKETVLTDVPLGGGETKTTTVTFPAEPADFYLFCRPHEGAGMHGTIHSGTGASGSHQAPGSPSSGVSDPGDDGYAY